jgi:transposase InsO family protein
MFLYENVVTRFGCPKILINDIGKHFLTKIIENMASLFQINHRKITPYHPQTNGQIECVNQTLVRILRKTIHVFKKDWY